MMPSFVLTVGQHVMRRMPNAGDAARESRPKRLTDSRKGYVNAFVDS